MVMFEEFYVFLVENEKDIMSFYVKSDFLRK